MRATLRDWGILPPPVTRTTKGPASDGCGPCGPPGCDARRTRTQCEGVRCPKESHMIVGGLMAGVGKRFGRRFMGKGSTIGWVIALATTLLLMVEMRQTDPDECDEALERGCEDELITVAGWLWIRFECHCGGSTNLILNELVSCDGSWMAAVGNFRIAAVLCRTTRVVN